MKEPPDHPGKEALNPMLLKGQAIIEKMKQWKKESEEEETKQSGGEG